MEREKGNNITVDSIFLGVGWEKVKILQIEILYTLTHFDFKQQEKKQFSLLLLKSIQDFQTFTQIFKNLYRRIFFLCYV